MCQALKFETANLKQSWWGFDRPLKNRWGLSPLFLPAEALQGPVNCTSAGGMPPQRQGPCAGAHPNSLKVISNPDHIGAADGNADKEDEGLA